MNLVPKKLTSKLIWISSLTILFDSIISIPINSTSIQSVYITPAEFLERNQRFSNNADHTILAESTKGQSPSLFWLGCSDSRVAEALVIQSGVGEVFVHRNVGNVYNPNDTSATAALAYAIDHLKVPHIVIVGHENCGGCTAALAMASSHTQSSKELDNTQDAGERAFEGWIKPILEIANALLKVKPSAGLSDLVAANVEVQFSNVIHHSILIEAWARGQAVSVHGWVYDLGSGKLKDLGLSQTGPASFI